MGTTVSSPLVSPPLLEVSDDLQEDRHRQPKNDVAKQEDTNNDDKAEDISIVFFDEDEDEDDLYYDDRDDSLCSDQFRCFGVPFLGSIHPPLFTMGPALTPVDTQPTSGNNDDEDEDPREGIESLQQELKAIDEIYNHEGHDDEDPQEDVEMLQRELEQAEETYATSEKKSTDHKGDGNNSDNTLVSDGHDSQKSSSFINLQQLLFHSGEGVGDNDDHSSITKTGSVSSSASVSLFSSSSTSCRIVEIYETRTTQLRPQLESEKERVPPERMGVPFRKCRNPSCSCHHPTKPFRHDRGRHHRNRAIIEKDHANDKDDNVENSSATDAQQVKRRNALLRLQEQSEKLLAMNMDEDDQTELTTGSSSSVSRHSGYSIRSDCQINARKNHHIGTSSNRNPDRGNWRQRSFSEDYNEGGTHVALSRETTLPESASSGPSTNATTSQFSPSTKENRQTHLALQGKQQCTQPPLPSRRSFGGSSNNREKTYPLMIQSNSSRCIHPDSFPEGDNNAIARRCRSEDFIDGSGNNLLGSYARVGVKDNTSSFSKETAAEKSVFRNKGKYQPLPPRNASLRFTERKLDDNRSKGIGGDRYSHVSLMSTTSGNEKATDKGDVDGLPDTKEADDPSKLGSPTCIMDEIHRTESFPRSRTTQHQPQHLPEQNRRQGLVPHVNSPGARTGRGKANGQQKSDDRHDKPYRSRLFDEREKSLKEYRQSIRFLQNQEKIDRRQKYSTSLTALNKTYRKQQKRRRQKQQQRDFERSMQLADLYHNMGLIHYQQARYDTARHVLQCGIDALIAHRASFVPTATAIYEETTDPFDDDYFDPFTSHSSPSQPLPPLPTLDEAAPHLANQALLLAAELVLAQGKIFAAQGSWNETKESSGKVLQWSDFQKERILGQATPSSHRRPEDAHHQANVNANKYWTEWGPTRARAQVLFARCVELECRPDIAMGYYREALSVQRCVLGPWHIQTADTLYRMGTLHAASGMMGFAGHCYEEALGLYQRYRSNGTNSATTRGSGSSPASMACIAADEATVLAGLGWIFLVQRDPARALVLTNQALDAMVHALGPSHTNVLALHHQLACIQYSLAAANQQQQQYNPLRQPSYHYPPTAQGSYRYPPNAKAPEPHF